MILAVAIALVMGKAVQSDSSDFLALFPHPSGQNGLEDYMKAGDLLSGPLFLVYQYWLPPDKRPTLEQQHQAEEARRKLLASMTPEERRGAEKYSERLSTADQEVASSLAGLNFLQTREDEMRRYSRALDLLVQGNQKPFDFTVVPMQPVGEEDSVVGRLAKQLTYLAEDAAFVYYSSGQTHKGTEIIEQALYMAHRLGSGDMPCQIVAGNLTSRVLGRLNEHLGAVSLDDSQRLAKLADELLDQRETFATMINNERARMAQSLEQGLTPILLDKSASNKKPSVAQQFATLPPEQKEAFMKRLHKLVDEQFNALTQRFDSPEDNWLAVKEPPSYAPADPKDLNELAELLSKTLTVGFDHEFMLSVVKSRTQLRLLRLHARIIQFRWQTSRLPQSLEELKLPRDQIYDPLSRKPFQYAVMSNSYKLSSAGVQDTGEIELRYQAPNDLPTHDPNRP